MKKIVGKLKEAFGFSSGPSLSSEELQAMFKAKYRAFRELLTANNNALEAMSEMETALRDGRTFSMAFIRSKSTVVSVNVFKMIQNLLAMSDGRYGNLTTSFKEIQSGIEAIIDKKISDIQGEWFIDLSHISRKDVELTGEKMANLGEAGSLPGIRVPPGFAITSSASRGFFLKHNLYADFNRIFQLTDAHNFEDMERRSQEVRRTIMESSLPSELEQELYGWYDRLTAPFGPDALVAVRSSALGEDLGRASFAGLYHTELNVRREELVSAYKSVLASKYSTRAMTYRLNKGYRHEDIVMCAGCLIMIKAELSGVCYSRSISGGLDTLDIFFTRGSAKRIVDGTGRTSHYRMERTAPHALAQQRLAGADREHPLSPAQAAELAAIAMRLETHFGSAQDIEWSIDAAGVIYVLQSRPISVQPLAQAIAPAEKVEDERLIVQGGVTGCSGAACGKVFTVRSLEDIARFPPKSVLVVEHPLPEWAPLLKIARALVAETGSEAGHLATISREYGLPSILSLDRATELLQPEALITVDANSRAIYRGCINELIEQSRPRPNPMDGSPVQATLVEALKLITPLHLTDPSSVYFRGKYCRTMHDITRFCHEKSVVEMFGFGERYRFDEGAAKRLMNKDAVLEWWAINLADGFSPDHNSSSKFIQVDELTSTPMLAIWAGMQAYPWAGPPSVNVRGMGSILFQSAMQPNLDPAVASNLNQRNYFLVSRNYCNLSVRLGYHYAMIEAFISSLRTERYVTFRFKGGAADEQRRVGRIELIAEILGRFDFRVELTGDALAARVEKRRRKFLYDRLRVLGYLIIHTRQIDMVMADGHQYARYRLKFIQEIEEMLKYGDG